MPATRTATRTLTTTEAAVLALLAIEGENSGYDLLKYVQKAIGYIWAPARSQLYSLLPRLVKDGYARSRTVTQAERPDKTLYRITRRRAPGARRLADARRPDDRAAFQLRLFVGVLTDDDVLVRHVEAFRDGHCSAARRVPRDRADEQPERAGLLPLPPAASRDPAGGARPRVGGLGVASAEATARMRLTLVLFVAVAVGCAAGNAQQGVSGAETDVRLFAAELERIHPNPYHATPRAEYARRVDELAARADSLDRDQLVVELMRLLALLGERDGHSGIYTLHTHPRPLHLYPLRTYWFSDGLTVVDGDAPGAKLVAIEGVPIDEAVARIRPLITRDNEWSFRERIPYYLVCAEVLRGLGISDGERVTFTLQSASGSRNVELTPIAAASYRARFPYYWQPPAAPPGVRDPLWVRYRGTGQAVKTLQRGRFVYVAYTQTGDAGDLAARIKRLARKPAFRRLIVDVRQNGGGDNTRYFALLDAIASKVVNRRSRPVVLTGTNDVLGRRELRRRRGGVDPGPPDRGAARRLAQPVGRLRSVRPSQRRPGSARRDPVHRARSRG